jgi:hypothetical protein
VSFERTCSSCGNTFTTDNFRKMRCKKNCKRASASANKVRTIVRQQHVVKFLAVDGEADTTIEGDPYVLLSVGSESLHREGEALTHRDIFPFLWKQHLKHPDHAFVGYFLGYDFSQWLKSISLHEAKMLLTAEGIAKRQRKGETASRNPTPWPVYIDNDQWEIDLLGMKRFKLRPFKSREPWMYICDVGPFFATSFLKAIDPADWPDEPICTAEEYATIREGKGNRDAAAFGPEMIRYNLLENDVLSRMMDRLNRGFVAIDVRLAKNKWFGPGQAAQAWMSGTDVPKAKDVEETVPKKALSMARDSYYGGWFEVFAHGHIPGTTYEYDINSAYPHIMRTLPCLMHGEWTEGPGSYVLVKAEVYGSDPYVGTIQHRETKETILRPHATVGTYWLHELQAGKKAGVISSVKILDAIGYRPCKCPPPLKDVADLYQQRLDVGKNTVHGKACKLTYNSMYGKLAQSQGKPVFSNPIYASLITSGCRSMILQAIATHPEGTKDVVMVATDGVYFRSPHPGLELDGAKLGAWDASEVTNMTILKPGVYWSDKDRESVKANRGLKLKSRGISAKDLAERMGEFDTLFRDWTPDKPWPSLTIDIAFRVTGPKVALMRNKWETCGDSVRDDKVVVNSNPQLKRDIAQMENRNGAWCSSPYPVPPSGTLESLPYRKEFGMTDLDADTGFGSITPDGDVRTVIQSLWSR